MKNNIITRLLLLFIVALAATINGFLRAFEPREECHNSFAAKPHPHGNIQLVAEAVMAVPFLLVKKGAAAGSFDLCGVNDEPLGVATDTVAVAEKGNVEHFGATQGSLTVIAAAAIAAQVRVYTAAAGKISSTGGAGTYLVGRSVTAAAAANDEIEIVPCFPVLQAA